MRPPHNKSLSVLAAPGGPRRAREFPAEVRTFQGSPGLGIPCGSDVPRVGTGLVLFTTVSPAPSTEPGMYWAFLAPRWPKECFHFPVIILTVQMWKLRHKKGSVLPKIIVRVGDG